MSYVSTPNAGQSLGGTRDQMRTNTDLLKASLAINHVDLGFGAQTGKHTFIQMPSQISDPTTAIDELALYVKTSSAVRLFLRQPSNGTIIQMSGPDPVSTTSGLTFLPGALLQIWDAPNIDSNNATIRDNSPFLFPNGGFPTNCFSVVLQGQKTGNSAVSLWIKDGTLSKTGFSIRTNSSNGEFTKIYYIAIGN